MPAYPLPVLLAACMLGLSLLAVLAFYTFVRTELLKASQDALTEIARQGAGAIKENLSGRLEALSSLAATDIVSDPSVSLPDKIRYMGDMAGEEGYRQLMLSDRTGISYDNLLQVTDQSGNPSFIDAMLRKRSISDPFAYGGPGDRVFSLSVPIQDGHVVIGVLTAYEDAAVLTRSITSIGSGSGSAAFLLDDDGRCIATANASVLPIGWTPGASSGTKNAETLDGYARQMREGRSGSGRYDTPDGPRHIGYAAVGNTGWSLGVTVPERKVLARFNRLTNWLVIASLFVSLLLPVLVWQFSRLSGHLRSQRHLATQAIRSASLFLVRLDRQMIIRSANDGFSQSFGLDPSALTGRSFADMSGVTAEQLAALLLPGRPVTLRISDDATGAILHAVWHVLDQREAGISGTTLLGVDITDRVRFSEQLEEQQEALEETLATLEEKESLLSEQNRSLRQSEETIRNMALHDELTGLPNRLHVYQAFPAWLAEQSAAALYYLDTDRFKMVNDTYGHNFGDRLIQAIAQRLSDQLGTAVPIARVGGDEFIVLARRTPEPSQAEPATCPSGADILACFDHPVHVGDIGLDLRCSIGCALYPEHGGTIGELLKHADLAMYQAKETGKGSLIVYTEEIGRRMDTKMDMDLRMRKGLPAGEFVLWQQPQYRILLPEGTSGTSASASIHSAPASFPLVGFETLLRWFPADGPSIPPSAFIPLAEENGQILEIGFWVMEQTFKKAAQQRKDTMPSLHFSCNVSGVQLRQPDFTSRTLALLAAHRPATGAVAIEITESCLIDDFEESARKLAILRAHGIAVHLDDFGTGFSSLNYLKHLPVDLVKLDRSFIENIHRSPMDRGVVRNIIRLSHDLGLQVVAEGVEEQEQLQVLQLAGCDLVQGYLTGRPMDDEGMQSLLAHGREP